MTKKMSNLEGVDKSTEADKSTYLNSSESLTFDNVINKIEIKIECKF